MIADKSVKTKNSVVNRKLKGPGMKTKQSFVNWKLREPTDYHVNAINFVTNVIDELKQRLRKALPSRINRLYEALDLCSLMTLVSGSFNEALGEPLLLRNEIGTQHVFADFFHHVKQLPHLQVGYITYFATYLKPKYAAPLLLPYSLLSPLFLPSVSYTYFILAFPIMSVWVNTHA